MWLDLIYKCSIWVSITARFFSSHSWQPRFVSQENIKGTQRQIFSGCSMIFWRNIIFGNFPKYPSFSIGLFELQSQFKDFMLVKPMIALRLHFCTTLIIDLSRINCNLSRLRQANFCIGLNHFYSIFFVSEQALCLKDYLRKSKIFMIWCDFPQSKYEGCKKVWNCTGGNRLNQILKMHWN